MSLVELLPTVRSLSRSDKLQLIQWIAVDLADTDESTSNPTDQIVGIGEDERVQAAVHALGLRNAVGRIKEGSTLDPDHVSNAEVDQARPFPIEAGQAIPICLPNESYEAAAIMLKILEERKSIS